MATQVQLRRGTSAENDSFTGAQGELTYDTTNKRVRIHDGGTAGGFETARADASNLKFPDGAVGTPAISFSSDTNTGIYRGGTDILKFVTAGTDAITINASQDVGIGIATPQRTLHLHEPSSDSNYLHITNTTTGTTSTDGMIFGMDGSEDGYIWHYESKDITIATNNQQAMKIANNGDISFYEDTGTTPKLFWDASAESLGIGTSSPNAPLNVNGTVELAGVLYRGIFGGTYQDSDIGALTGGNPSAVQIQSPSSSRPATLLLGGSQGTNELLGTIGFYNSGNTDTKRLRSYIYGGQSGGTSNEQGGVLVFATASDTGTTPTQRMRIDSSGNVGIGTDSPTVDSSLAGLSVNASGTVAQVNNVNGATLKLTDPATGGNRGLGITLQGTEAAISNCESGSLRFGTGNTERMRIDGSGNLLVGKTSSPASGSGGVGFVSAGVYDVFRLLTSSNNTATIAMVQFENPNGTVGSISMGGSSTSYNTSSDHRLKENVVEMTDATTRLKQLQPKRFNFIADADTTVDGFLAHEVQSVVPEAITGTHNEVDADGNPVYQGIDQSKLVPLLVKTIQELEARIVALETALENGE